MRGIDWDPLLTWVPIVCAALEVAYITVQAALGQASHFNTGTPFHAAMYSLMFFGAVGLVGVCAWMGLLVFLRHRTQDVYAFAVALGLGLTCLLGGGFGIYLGGQEDHWVGGSQTDADGLWLLNWSRDGGDLRVAHFFGIHAMQVLPLLGYGLRNMRQGVSIVTLIAVCYTAFSLGTLFQATRGIPLL